MGSSTRLIQYGILLAAFACQKTQTEVGVRCEPESLVPAGDGCNECTCGANGELLDCTSDFCPLCPTPRQFPPCELGATCEAGPTWARDPTTGVCCPYAKAGVAPEGWRTYASSAECNPLGCACDVTVDGRYKRNRGTLACRCQEPGDCPTFPDPMFDCLSPLLLTRGCGLLQFSSVPGFAGRSMTFDATTKELLSIGNYSDIQWGVCDAFSSESVAGPSLPEEDPSCTPMTCGFCGGTSTWNGFVPACE